VAAEVLALTLPTSRSVESALESAQLSPEQSRRLLARPAFDVDYIPMYTVQPEEAARYYDVRHFTSHDFIVVTDAVRGRYLADTVRFAPEARFYRDLDRLAPLAARFVPGSRARGPEIEIYRVPASWDATLERERGRLVLEPWDPRARIHVPDYMEFLEGVARAAYAKGRWAMAARYYAAMLDVGRAGWMPELQQISLLRLLGLLEERAGRRAEAARLDETYLARVPGDSLVRAALERLSGSRHGARGGP
jgi:hypothetical protein